MIGIPTIVEVETEESGASQKEIRTYLALRGGRGLNGTPTRFFFESVPDSLEDDLRSALDGHELSLRMYPEKVLYSEGGFSEQDAERGQLLGVLFGEDSGEVQASMNYLAARGILVTSLEQLDMEHSIDVDDVRMRLLVLECAAQNGGASFADIGKYLQQELSGAAPETEYLGRLVNSMTNRQLTYADKRLSVNRRHFPEPDYAIVKSQEDLEALYSTLINMLPGVPKEPGAFHDWTGRGKYSFESAARRAAILTRIGRHGARTLEIRTDLERVYPKEWDYNSEKVKRDLRCMVESSRLSMPRPGFYQWSF